MRRLDLSLSCSLGEHRECAHMAGLMGVPEGQVALCLCECHQSCPLSSSRSAPYLVWRSTCTCAVTEDVRHTQDRVGVDPGTIARIMEFSQQELAGGEASGTEVAIRAYRAADQAARQSTRHADTYPAVAPHVAMNLIVDLLANAESDAGAARLLGLTEAEVATARKAAREFRDAAGLRIPDSTQKRRKWLGFLRPPRPMPPTLCGGA
jgi:hypothetical protein